MSSGVEADIALDAAVVLSLGMNRVVGKAAGLTAVGAEALAALAQGRADARAAALAEAEGQDRAIREVIDRNARIAVLAQAQQQMATTFPLPAPLPLGDHPAEALLEWCAATDKALADAERRISEHQAEQLAARVFDIPAGGLRADLSASRTQGTSGGEREAEISPGTEAARDAAATGRERAAGDEAAAGGQVAGGQVAGGQVAGGQVAGGQVAGGEAAGGSGAGRVGALVRVLGRLAVDVATGDRARVAEAAGRLAEARTDGEAEGLLNEVRLRVQRANRDTEERRAAERRQAAEREAREQAEAERRYVLDAVTGAFEDMGYEVQAGFETLTARDGTVLLTRGSWPEHSVKMRVEDAGQLRAAMVRTKAPESEDDRRRDAEREREWCAAFEAARERLAAAGIRSEVTWRVEPGDQDLPVSAEARQTRARTEQKARRRQREI